MSAKTKTRAGAVSAGELSANPASRSVQFRLVGICLLLLVGAGLGLAYYLAERMEQAMTRTSMLWRSLEDSHTLLGYAVDMEAGHRGFLLTGDRAQLESYELAMAEIPLQIGVLREQLARFPRLDHRLTEVEQRLLQLQGETTVAVALYESKGRAAALQATRADLGKPAMDELRRSFRELEKDLNAALVEERAKMGSLVQQRTIATYITLLLVGALGVLAMVLGGRHFEILRAQEHLRLEVMRRQRESVEKSNFLAQASHEIRTPMNAIFGFSGLLHDRLQDPVDRRFIESIMSSARALLTLINDLLDLTKIEAGKIEISVAPTSLREIVDGVLALFSQQAVDKGLMLRAEIGSSVPSTVMVDADRLRQMLVNLVGNAIKYTDAGEVSVRVSAGPATPGSDGRRCVFEVADTGVGIEPDELEAIFHPFVQARSHEARGVGGTGLGLAITRQLARVMGGDVSADSTPGQGSVFRVVLDNVVPADEPPLSGRIGGRLKDLTPSRFLIVDDVKMNRDVLLAMFRGTHHEVATAGGGLEAVALAPRFKPDAVLLDLRMDDLNGIEVAKRLRADPVTAAARIVVVTASNIATEEESQLFDSLMLKPFTEETLFRELARLLGAEDAEARVDDFGAIGQAAPTRARFDETVAELDRLLADSWPVLKDTLTMSEVRQFAERVEVLARQAGFHSLYLYGRKLSRAASSFDVARAETLLMEYPGHIAELRRNGEATRPSA